MIESELANWITNQGFAIAVAVYLLYERTKVTLKMLKVMTDVSKVLDKIADKLDRIK